MNQQISLNVSGSTIADSYVLFVRPDGSTLNESLLQTTDQFVDPTVLDAAGTWTLVIDPYLAETGSLTVLANSGGRSDGHDHVGDGEGGDDQSTRSERALHVQWGLNQKITLNVSGSTIAGGYMTFLRPDGSTLNGPLLHVRPTVLRSDVLDVAGTWTLVHRSLLR